MIPQGVLRFPGIEAVRRWSMTLSHGIAPSVAQLTVVPQFEAPAEIGTLSLLYGDDVKIDFPFAAIDSAQTVRDGDGQLVNLQILDRRWAWKFGVPITGRYNVRLADGTVDLDTQATPQQLLWMLLQRMGETGANVSLVPNLSLPEVDWDYANPATELAILADSLGCRVILRLDNTVMIAPEGIGYDLPDLPAIVRTRNYGIDPANRPESLMVVCGPSRFENWFTLEAVGQEPDTYEGGTIDANGVRTGGTLVATGEIRPIDQLSYRPYAGWKNELPPLLSNVVAASNPDVLDTSGATNLEARTRAQATVYKWWRIKGTADTSATTGFPALFSIFGAEDSPVTALWQILPLESGLIETFVQDGVETPLPPQISGSYSKDGNKSGIVVFSGNDVAPAFTIDAARGLVKFSQPMYIPYSPDGDNSQLLIAPALLGLRIAHPVKDSTTLKPVRQTFNRELPGALLPTGPAVTLRADLRAAYQGVWSGIDKNGLRAPIGLQNNLLQITAETDYYLDAAAAQFDPVATGQLEYAGIVPISPDGAIQQVRWQSDSSGGALTIASRNCEHDSRVPDWNERISVVRQRAAAAKAARKGRDYGYDIPGATR